MSNLVKNKKNILINKKIIKKVERKSQIKIHQNKIKRIKSEKLN